jgi:hypothetical protein
MDIESERLVTAQPPSEKARAKRYAVVRIVGLPGSFPSRDFDASLRSPQFAQGGGFARLKDEFQVSPPDRPFVSRVNRANRVSG